MLERLRDRDRGTALILALVVEALLVLAVLSIGLYDPPKPPGVRALVSVNVAAPPAPEAEQPEPEVAQAKAPQETAQVTPPIPVPSAAPVQPAPPVIETTRNQVAVTPPPRQPGIATVMSKGTYGPVDNGIPGDSKRVGSAPNGEPMYAAAWYREPYESELSGYLSTAAGPGWALITCRTAPDYRVENCLGLAEYPQGSQIQRAVLAAAWQFKVRPPRVGGVAKIGAWVRIRIEYGVRPRDP